MTDNRAKETPAFYEGLKQVETLAALEGMYNNRNGLALITAEPGAGVTSIIEHFCDKLPTDDIQYETLNTAIIDAANNTVGGFLAEILSAFGYEIEDARQSELLSVTSMICEHQTIAGLPPLIAIEHVDRASPKVLEVINKLAGLRHRSESVCRLILTGGPNLKDIAAAELMGEVRKRVCAEIDIEPMSDQEARQFIEHVLVERGLSAHNAAIDNLVRLSNGLAGYIVSAIDHAANNEGGTLESGDVLLALENVQPHTRESRAQSNDTTQIQNITLQKYDTFNDGKKQPSNKGAAPLGEILVNRNGELLQRHVISRRKVLIGRAPHNDIVLDSKWVSRHHAILICDATSASLADVNSTNGVTLNSRELRQGNLRHHDIIVIGEFRLKYVNELAAPRAAEDDTSQQTETRVLRSLSVADLANEDATVPAPDSGKSGTSD
ncbi:MAG: FHA domain-containing protein [Pseudomonadota bacterium]